MEQEHMYMIVFAFCIIGLLGVCAYVGVQEPNTIQTASIQEPIKQPSIIKEIAGDGGDWGIVSGGVTTVPLAEPELGLEEVEYGTLSKGSSGGLSDMVSLDDVEVLTDDIPLETTDLITDVMESAENSNVTITDTAPITNLTDIAVTNETESEIVIIVPDVVEPVVTPIETKPIETVTPKEEENEEKEEVTKPVEKETEPEDEDEVEEAEEDEKEEEPAETPAEEEEDPETNETVEETPTNDTDEPEQNETVDPVDEPTEEETPAEEETPVETPTEESTPDETETPAESEQITPDTGGNSTPV